MGGGRDSGRERRRGRGPVKGIGKGGETDERRREREGPKANTWGREEGRSSTTVLPTADPLLFSF